LLTKEQFSYLAKFKQLPALCLTTLENLNINNENIINIFMVVETKKKKELIKQAIDQARPELLMLFYPIYFARKKPR